MEIESLKMKFSTKWCIYDHAKSTQNDYDECTRFSGSFDNVHDFWYLYNNFPRPSDLFYQKHVGKPYYFDETNTKREIASISVFRDGIQPKWEDSKNIDGGDITLKKFCKPEEFSKNTRKINTPVEYLDTLWLKLILNSIGEQFTHSEHITGMRVVDSSKPSSEKPLYRIELWYSDLVITKTIENEIKKALNLSVDDKLTFRKHRDCL